MWNGYLEFNCQSRFSAVTGQASSRVGDSLRNFPQWCGSRGKFVSVAYQCLLWMSTSSSVMDVLPCLLPPSYTGPSSGESLRMKSIPGVTHSWMGLERSCSGLGDFKWSYRSC
ncbi:hypothetical protein H1C71_005204 [Ictidomys tridecemlineatus]|nr:hypothetical protein H1C71_005204 [Ictidomys tridecemlineatus]